VIFKDCLNNIVDPQILDYKYFLKDKTKTYLLTLAKLADISIGSNLRKEDLTCFLSVEIPNVLPTLLEKFDCKDRLKCEIIVSAGGYMSAWELQTRTKLESRLSKKLSGASTQDPGGHGERSIRRQKNYRLQYVDDSDEDEDDDEEDEDVEDYYYQPFEQKKPPLLDVFVFPKPLLIDSNYIYKKGVKKDLEVYLIIPREARGYFKTRSLNVDLVALNDIAGEIARPSALEAPELLNLIQTLLDNISSKRPKPTPKAGLIPKAIFLPIFTQLVASSQVYKELDDAEYFCWSDFDELLTGFIYDKKLVRRSVARAGEAERLEVVSSKASEILSSSKILNEAFLDWWANEKNSNCQFLFKSKIFEFDSKMPQLKSDEIATRKLLQIQIRNEMKPGTWYFTQSILGKCTIESDGNLFKDRAGYSLSAYGPGGGITGQEELLEEFLSMMLVFPLCLLGILQTNNSNKELMMLGRWARQPISVDTVMHDRLDMKSANLVTVTANFEVILKSRSPEGRILAFHLREFCDSLTKSGSDGAIIDVFKLSRESVLRALRTGNYTWQTIISLLTRAVGSADKIPQNVRHELTDWGERYGEVEIRTAEVLKCRDEIIAESLINDPALKKYITSRMGKTTIEIKPGSRSKILSRCDKLGYLTKG
jgi:Helicase conserved C-terminal domain